MITTTREISTRGTYRVVPCGVLRVTGNDARDFLNRMSTNDLAKIRDGEHVTTLLTNEKGRLIDVVRVIRTGETHVLLTSEGAQEDVVGWLQRFVIMEDIQIVNETSLHAVITFIGELPDDLIERLHFNRSQLSAPKMVRGGRCEGKPVYVFVDELWPGRVHMLLVPAEVRPAVVATIAETAHARELADEELRVKYIEEGVPVYGAEITREVNPLELQLQRFISFTKGCYIGQEVIARLDTYDKLQKRLTGFRFSSAIREPMSGGKVMAGDEEVGWTTSHAHSRRLNASIALGFLKKGVEALPLAFVDGASGNKFDVQPVTLPFEGAHL